ncbi:MULTISPECIES: hypothetical protein [Rickettsieae]|jgi:cell division protein FtsB|uniref:hypothetical protein n=1 Tax=Rickettsieae TaxID=33988 RepID=UPI000B9B1144|nr:hypothetical protein [Rickettsia endosymbiont of Culicoides newsteadi]MCC8415925.1 hypothetical protein [Rickettsia endosymbiont of Gnoriste bilineata]OZG31703.1 hypothetical protein RiCNE_09000 [Rickettsia endosymbiont of Culicoides newsteadi]HJD56635.1 hypothetical protein [Rickettsia endosymbiont of Sericostoma sp. HW-2014]HJD63852.1 hypothetical protein [Rickettsia endosymbiont of Sericostoma sp.]
MTINTDLLLKLMQEVDQGIEGLLSDIAEQHQEINRLKDENKYLKDNYTKILEQIAVYIAELEEIKHKNT